MATINAPIAASWANATLYFSATQGGSQIGSAVEATISQLAGGTYRAAATVDLSSGSAGYVEIVLADALGNPAWSDEKVRIDDAGALVDEYGTLEAGNTFGAFLNRKPDKIIRVSSKSDGYLTEERVRITPGATMLVALAWPDPDDWHDGMDLPVSPDTDQLTVDADAYGVNRNLAMVEVTCPSGASIGDSNAVSLPVVVQRATGLNDPRKIRFEVIDPDQ